MTAPPMARRCFLRFPDALIVNAAPRERRFGVNENGCLEFCQTYPDAMCRSASFHPLNGICDVFQFTARKEPAQLIRFTGANYYEPNGLCRKLTR